METITQEKIQEAAEKIVKEYQPEKIILFGSYAWGKPTADSDVDLFIIKKTENTRALAGEIDGSLWGGLFPIDIIIYNPDQVEKRRQRGDFFILDILQKGKVLYAK